MKGGTDFLLTGVGSSHCTDCLWPVSISRYAKGVGKDCNPPSQFRLLKRQVSLRKKLIILSLTAQQAQMRHSPGVRIRSLSSSLRTVSQTSSSFLGFRPQSDVFEGPTRTLSQSRGYGGKVRASKGGKGKTQKNSGEASSETGKKVGNQINVTQKEIGAVDEVSEILEANPNRVEPRILIDGQLFTSKELELRRKSFILKAIDQVSGLVSSKNAQVNQEASESLTDTIESHEGQSSASTETTDTRSATEEEGAVYLKDLLRDFRGQRYVPEEAFRENVIEVDEFFRNLRDASQLPLQAFVKFSRNDQVKLLTSRAVRAPSGGMKYFDFLVELKDAPGEQELQQKLWAMRLDEAGAAVALSEFKGRQKELETGISAFVELPASKPHPAAATISGRIVLEASVAAALLFSLLSSLASLATSLAVALYNSSVFVLVELLWPMTSPIWWLAISALEVGISILFTVLKIIFMTFGKPLYLVLAPKVIGILMSLASLFESEVMWIKLKSTARMLGVMVVILATMAAAAKYTSQRRTMDYRKWDLWTALQFGQSKPQARVEGTTGVAFADVAGIDEAVKELKELVEYLGDPQRFTSIGTRPPHGVLLEGPPGCGKTLLAKAIAGEAGVPFYQMAGPEFSEILVGVGAARVRDLFKRAKVNRPAVVFIDEIDALGAARASASLGQDSMDDNVRAGITERETTLNQLLVELDGFDTGTGVIFIGATNRMDMLDPALLRPGRFDRKITIMPPAAMGRIDILRVHSRKMKLSPSLDLETVARNLQGWSGAELANLMQEAAMMAVRRGGDEVTDVDLRNAADRLILGVLKTRRLDERKHNVELIRRMAVKELGPALTSLLLIRFDSALIEPPLRISLLPRGHTESWSVYNRLDDEFYTATKRRTILHRMQVFLGGRAAEEALWGRNSSTLSTSHLADASWLAYKFLSIWHMGGKVFARGFPAPWKKKARSIGPNIDFEGGLYNDYNFTDTRFGNTSDHSAAEMAKDLLHEAYAATWQLLNDHKAALMKAVNVLVAKNEISCEELDLILDLYPAGTPEDVVANEEFPSELPEQEASEADQESTEDSLAGLEDAESIVLREDLGRFASKAESLPGKYVGKVGVASFGLGNGVVGGVMFSSRGEWSCPEVVEAEPAGDVDVNLRFSGGRETKAAEVLPESADHKETWREEEFAVVDSSAVFTTVDSENKNESRNGTLKADEDECDLKEPVQELEVISTTQGGQLNNLS